MRSIIVWAVIRDVLTDLQIPIARISPVFEIRQSEERKNSEILPAENPETVLIAGGGIAGLEAAIVLKQRGHLPILCEASDRLGGQFLTAGEAPRKEEMKQAVIAMAHQAEKLGVEIRLNTPVTPELIKEIHPHTVINAIGAVPIIRIFREQIFRLY